MFNTSDPVFWVSLAFVLLVGLSAKKVAKLIASVLDGHSAKIKSELDTARSLREEAEAVLQLYKQKQAEFTEEAKQILEKSRADAARNTAAAQEELKKVLEIRTKAAMEKIAQEESAAIAEVRSHVAEVAIAAARRIMLEQASKTSADELANIAISGIERKLH